MSNKIKTTEELFNKLYSKFDHKKLVGQTLYLLGRGDNSMKSAFQRTEEWWTTLWWKEANCVISIITSSGHAMSDYWAYVDVPKEEIDALNIQVATDEIKEAALQWLLSRSGSDACKLTFKPQYINCVLLCFEDHNYYDDSDSWTVFYDGNKHEIVEEYWTTRGACQTCNANPRDIQYNFDTCPADLMEEVKEYLRKDIAENFDFSEMARNVFKAKYKYQQESAEACIKEFCELAPKAIERVDNIWLLCKLSKKVHTYTDFDYRFGKNYKGESFVYTVMKSMTTKMVEVRQRSKVVYGTRYNGTVQSCKFYAANGFNQLYDATVILVDVPDIEKTVYIRLSGKKEYAVGTEISFAGILGKEGDKYQFINKARVINESDKLSWH